jgi:hypothetical protein
MHRLLAAPILIICLTLNASHCYYSAIPFIYVIKCKIPVELDKIAWYIINVVDILQGVFDVHRALGDVIF